MKVILWAAILCLGVFPAGCSDESDHDFAPAPDGFEISMDLSSSTIYRGQSTTLTLEIANYGPDIELDFACHDHFGFRIKDQFGNVEYEWPSCNPIPSHLTMRRGYKDTVAFPVPGGTLPVLEEGTYTLSAGILEHEDEFPWNKTLLTVLEPR